MKKLNQMKKKPKKKNNSKTCYLPKTSGMTFKQYMAQNENQMRAEKEGLNSLIKKHIKKK